MLRLARKLAAHGLLRLVANTVSRPIRAERADLLAQRLDFAAPMVAGNGTHIACSWGWQSYQAVPRGWTVAMYMLVATPGAQSQRHIGVFARGERGKQVITGSGSIIWCLRGTAGEDCRCWCCRVFLRVVGIAAAGAACSGSSTALLCACRVSTSRCSVVWLAGIDLAPCKTTALQHCDALEVCRAEVASLLDEARLFAAICFCLLPCLRECCLRPLDCSPCFTDVVVKVDLWALHALASAAAFIRSCALWPGCRPIVCHGCNFVGGSGGTRRHVNATCTKQRALPWPRNFRASSLAKATLDSPLVSCCLWDGFRGVSA